MARKRKIRVLVKDEPNGNIRELTWVEWAKSTLMRYWYVIIVLAVDMFAVLEIMRVAGPDVRLAMAGVSFLALILVEAFVYLKLWGKEGLWRYDE